MFELTREDTPIRMYEAKYLKHVAELKDIKVSIPIITWQGRRFPLIHIGDYEFKGFQPALTFLQQILPQIGDPDSLADR